jgi:probable nitrogen fixation protein
MTSTDIATPTPAEVVAASPFLQALVRQIRANDAYGTFRNWSDDLLLKAYVIPKKQRREIPVEGDVDPLTLSRILAFYRAIATQIETETGQLCQVVVDLSHEGFGWVLIFSSRLILVSRTLRDVQRFGFDTYEKLAAEGDKLTQKGIEMANRFPEVCNL